MIEADQINGAVAGHYIVAIGASAGGLEAIHEFFDNMSPSDDLSFIIIQHLSPDYKPSSRAVRNIQDDVWRS